MNALPYRVGETPLMTRERILEQELRKTRYLLDAYANEEVRIERLVRLRELPPRDLYAIQATIAELASTEARLALELTDVRDAIVARGERRQIRPSTEADEQLTDLAFALTVGLMLVIGALLALLRPVAQGF